MQFIYKKKGHSPDTYRLWTERKRLLKSEKTRIVGKGSDQERLQEYRPQQQARKRIVELNIQFYKRFFHYCETLGTTPLRETQQNNHDHSKLIRQREPGEQRQKREMPYKCTQESSETQNRQPNQTATDGESKYDGRWPERTHRGDNQKDRDFALDLPMLVDGTARDVKILSAIAALEKDQPEDIFYPYRPHRNHLTTRI